MYDATRRLLPVFRTLMNTAKVQICTINANLTTDEFLLLLWVGVPPADILVQERGKLTGCQVGYAVLPEDWFADATSKLQERAPRVSGLRRSCNDRVLL